MTNTLLAVLCLVAVVALGVPVRAAPPILYHSPADDGVNPGVPVVVGEGTNVVLHLYVDGGSVPSTPGSECYVGANDEICGWDFGLIGPGTVTFTSFTPSGDVEFNLGTSALRMNGGNPEIGTLGPSKLGDLEFAGIEGDSIDLQRGDVVTSALTLTQVAPGAIVTVPEPGSVPALTAGAGLLIWLARRRRADPRDRNFSATRLCWSIGIGGGAMTP